MSLITRYAILRYKRNTNNPVANERQLQVRCSVVEKGVTPERTEFLKKLLELNKYTVKVAAEADATTFKIGVTDMLFNPVVDVYKRDLISSSGKKVTPAYWLQESDKETEAEVNYWTF